MLEGQRQFYRLGLRKFLRFEGIKMLDIQVFYIKIKNIYLLFFVLIVHQEVLLWQSRSLPITSISHTEGKHNQP